MNEINTQHFIGDISRYFRDFLETDFKKRRLPKRSIQGKDSNGLPVGISLKKYLSLQGELWSLLNETIKPENEIKITQGKYRSAIPLHIQDLINRQIVTIDSRQIELLQNSAVSQIKDFCDQFSEDVDELHGQSIAFLEQQV